MCLLALINIDSVFTDEELLDFIESNNDGYGFMRPATESYGVVKYKQPTSDNFVANFRAWQDMTRASGQTEFAMHTRMRTHGEIDFHNAHPHKVTEDMWLMHNGVLHIDTKSNEKNSDTIHYIEQVIAPLMTHTHLSAWQQPALLGLIGESIGRSNKFVICTPAGFGVVNREDGIEFRGSWFSNTYAWSIWCKDSRRGNKGRREQKFDWKEDWMYGGGYDFAGYPKGDAKADVAHLKFDEGDDAEVMSFVEEIEFIAEQFDYDSKQCRQSWLTAGEYDVEAVKMLAYSILEDDGVEGLNDYLDVLFGELSDLEEVGATQ